MAEPVAAAKSSVAPARVAAAHVLQLVERGTAHSDDQLRTPRVEALSRQDRDLTTELVRGTLRWQMVLDREIAARLRYPESDMHLGVMVAMRMGAYQLLFLDRIPSHAAVNDSVELAKEADGQAMASLTNAVLRRLLRERETLRGIRTEAEAAYPRWMLERWRKRFGGDGAKAICAFGQQPSPVTVRMSASFEGSDDAEPGAFLTRARRIGKGGDPAGGRMQDEASQLVGELAAHEAGPAILDACAAPGGKTAILAERNPASALTAMDVSAARLRITERRLPWNTLPPEGRAEPVRWVPGDATMLLPGPVYSTVLCDMPCSGTGTLGRNPEIRHRLTEAGLARQAERQRAILASALRTLQPGGRLLYSTCSLEPEENEAVVEAVLAGQPGVELQPIGPELDALLAAGVLSPEGHGTLLATALAGPYLRTVPGVHPCDGFFAALLTRT